LDSYQLDGNQRLIGKRIAGLKMALPYTQIVTQEKMRIIYVARDIELRIISLLVRAKEISEEVVLVDLGSSDSTIELAEEFGSIVLNYDSELSAPKLSEFLLDSKISDEYSNLVIKVSSDWRLRDLPVVVNRSREGWDIYFSFSNDGKLITDNPEELVIGSLDIDHLFISPRGLIELSKCSALSNALNFPNEFKVRMIESKGQIKIPQRESLATASRFAQLFYWMLETKHPLFLFGVPGVVLFILGYKLSGNVVDTFSELNSVSIGVTLTTIAMTLIGLFAIMVALILYIMGKQVEQIQSQYDWKRVDDNKTLK
tara:strand:- start:1484 stop:2425 length:942 start_codon:yes stop_codon:yes gene_type:complete